MRMLSAISFGVFWRSAPSTSVIMRSRKLSPGTAVTRTTIWSERTRVPPVTAERSPPDSRMTGADSPVIADSSTLAIPSMTSPSAGMTSPAETTTSSPSRSAALGTSSSAPVARRRWAIVAARVFRSSSACALPRPSATASAKFAKSTVNQSQAATRPAKTFSWVDESERFFSHRNVTSTLPSSTTNMTGLRAMRRGSSFRMLSPRGASQDRGVEERAGLVWPLTAPAARGSARGRGRGST